MTLRAMFAALLCSASLASQPVPSAAAVIPAATHAPGAGGTLWRTDLVIHNPSDLARPGGGLQPWLTLELIPSGLEGSLPHRRQVPSRSHCPPAA
jgi:hypothetical protein